MQDTRLTNMRECLEAAVRYADLQVVGLIRDTERILAELEDENLTDHERIDLAQARQFLRAAQRNVADAQRQMGLAAAEFKVMEGQP